MSIELKIKSKHLATEPAIICAEERKALKQAQWAIDNTFTEKYVEYLTTYLNLSGHRKYNVRNEARATFLARAFLSNKKYSSVEQNVKNQYLLKATIIHRVIAMVNKYGKEKISYTDIVNWFNE